MPTDPPPFPDLEQIHIEAHRAYQRTPGSGATAVANAIRAALEAERACDELSKRMRALAAGRS